MDDVHATADLHAKMVREHLKDMPDLHSAHARKIERERPELFEPGRPKIPPRKDPRLIAYPPGQRLRVQVGSRIAAECLFVRLTPQEQQRVVIEIVEEPRA